MDTNYSNHPGKELPAPTLPASAPRTLARQLWGLNWSNALPNQLTNGAVVKLANYGTVVKFMAEHAPEIFALAPDSPFLFSRSSPAKSEYYEHLADHFALWQGEQLVGVVTANASDWSSYYLRNIAILPAFQGQGMQRELFEHFFRILRRHGVERFEIEISPSNVGQLHALNRLEFHTVGTKATERWGMLLQLVRYLRPENQEVFLDQFCVGPRPHTNDPKHGRRNK